MPEQDHAQDMKDQARDTAGKAGGGKQEHDGERAQGNGTRTVTGELKQVIREAAIAALAPAAASATTAAAKYAVTKGPELVTKQVGPRIQDAGGAKAIASMVPGKAGTVLKGASKVAGAGEGISNLASKLKPGKGKDSGGPEPSGFGRGRRLPVQESVDVAVPIDVAYNQWTQFEELPKFMHRVERIEQRDDTHLMWHENIWGVRRQWEAEITEQKPNDRIVWHSTGGPKQVGVVAFSKLADNLTRVQVSLDFQPKGLFEKTASGMRITRRALMSDLMRFKAFIEMRDEETGEWRGLIEDGEVKDEQDQAQDQGDEQDRDQGAEDDYDEDQGVEDEYDEDEGDEESDEDHGPEDEYDDDSDEDEDEDYDEGPEDEYDEGDEESEEDHGPEDEYDADSDEDEEAERPASQQRRNPEVRSSPRRRQQQSKGGSKKKQSTRKG